MKKKKYLILPLIGLATLASCHINIEGTITDQNKVVEDDPSKKTDDDNNNSGSTTNPDDNNNGGSTTNPNVNNENTTYTVTFYNGTNVLSTNEIATGTKVSKPADPVKEGYSFVGWFISNTATTPYDFNSAVNSSLNLYARFVQKFNVVFKDGTTSITEKTVKNGEKVTSFNPEDKTGKSFEGWYKDASLNVKYNFNDPVTSDLTLYAKYVNVYTVTFKNGNSTIDTKTIKENNNVEAPTTNPTKAGYRFVGWRESESDSIYFDFNNKISSNLVLYAVFEEVEALPYVCASYNEGAYIEWADSSLNNVSVKYKLKGSSTSTAIDKELIRLNSGIARADILGLKAGNYTIEVTKSDGSSFESDEIAVQAYERDGYAHFASADDTTGVNVSDGIGAYKNDGTLKDNAVVVYVNEANKNTVQAKIKDKTYTGISAILKASTDKNYPVNVRILGTVGAATWNHRTVSAYSAATTTTIKGANDSYLQLKNYDQSELISSGFNTLNETEYTELKGLTNKIKYDSKKHEFDSYYNMLDISNAKNVTVEGVGVDAKIFQWGFTWKSCTSIEVKNLTFDSYTEDACSFEGGDDSTTLTGFKTGHLWVHNNTFKRGVNYWDVCSEQDKHDGDGATDFKKLAYVSISYNHYINNHKTGLVGGSDTQHTACITFDHNFYDQCQSRLPFARQANMHMYNNYYYKSSGNNMQIYAGAFAFIENCYFENTKKTFDVKTSDGKVAAIKSYNNTFDNCSSAGATIVTSRTQTVTNGNLYGQSFDTDPNVFYYDDIAKKTKATHLTSAEQAKQDCILYAGVLKESKQAVPNITTYTVTFKNGEETLKTISVSEKCKATNYTPELEGYTFVNWYSDSAFTSLFNFNTQINSNTTIYGKFEKMPTYNVEYYNESELLYTEEVIKNNTITYVPNVSGKTLEGWYTDSNLTTKYESSSLVTGDLKLYGNFVEEQEKTYVLTGDDFVTLVGGKKVLSGNVKLNDVVTATKNLKTKSDTYKTNTEINYISSNKNKSKYDSQTQEAVIIFNIAEGKTAHISINLINAANDGRIAKLHNVNLDGDVIAQKDSGLLEADVNSGTYVLEFTEGRESKINNITVVVR
ncbi:MAG: InlB B-repeat-containing protein [Acholeplasmatales bacterium]|nr:InlB B-repeat-containing protein [Acholeplasmatales bacterium]